MRIKQVDYTRQNIYFSAKDGFYYSLNLRCELSGCFVNDLAVVMIGWSKSSQIGCNFLVVDESQFVLARESFGSKIYDHYTQVLVIITDCLPLDCVLWDYTSPPRTGGRYKGSLDVFTVADEELANNRSDHLHLVSSNPSQSIQLDFVDGRELLALKDKELDFEEGD